MGCLISVPVEDSTVIVDAPSAEGKQAAPGKLLSVSADAYGVKGGGAQLKPPCEKKPGHEGLAPLPQQQQQLEEEALPPVVPIHKLRQQRQQPQQQPRQPGSCGAEAASVMPPAPQLQAGAAVVAPDADGAVAVAVADGGGNSPRAPKGGAGGGDDMLSMPQEGEVLPLPLAFSARQVVARNSGTRARRLSFMANLNQNTAAAALLAEHEAAGAGGPAAPPRSPSAAAAAAAAALASLDGSSGSAAPSSPRRVRRSVDVSVACMSRAGREPAYKKTNQDSCFAYEKFISEHESLFGTMDGHGPQGHFVSAFVKQHLPVLLADALAAGAGAGEALAGGFTEVDARLGASRVDCEFSGSTCSVAYLKGDELTTAWVGDSRCVLARASGPQGRLEAVDLTADHKPTQPGERERILRNQGRVERLVDELGQPMGPPRVWLQYAWVPGLAMSRALGDQLAHTVGVTSEPEVTVTRLTPADRFMVLASDGVWEFITSAEAVEIVAAAAAEGGAEAACRALVDEAYQRWLIEEDGVVDDITAVVVFFLHDGHPHGACEAAPAGGQGDGEEGEEQGEEEPAEAAR